MTAPTAPEGAPASTADAATSPPAEPAFDVEAGKAAMAELAALKAKLADDKKADRAAKARAQEEAEKAGELAKALESAKARLAELEPLEPLAQRWRSHEEAQTKALDAEAASLPDAFKALYAKQGDLEGKAEVIAAFKAASAGAPAAAKVPGTPPAMGAPAGLSDLDIEAAFSAKDGGKKLAELKARDGNAVTKWIAAKMNGGGSGKSPSLGIGRFAG